MSSYMQAAIKFNSKNHNIFDIMAYGMVEIQMRTALEASLYYGLWFHRVAEMAASDGCGHPLSAFPARVNHLQKCTSKT